MLQKLAVPQRAKILPSFMEPEFPLPHYHYPTLSRINPQFCRRVSLRPYIILPSKSRSSKWSLSIRSTTENLHAPLSFHILSTCSAPLVWAGIAQSLQGVATGRTVRGSDPGGARFSAPVQTGPGGHPASCTMGTGPLPGVKRLGRDVDHPHQSSAEVKERRPQDLPDLLQGEFYVLLTVHPSIILYIKPTWCTMFLLCLFLFSTYFGRLCAHHQEKQLCLCDTCYSSLCVDDSLPTLHTRQSSIQNNKYQASH